MSILDHSPRFSVEEARRFTRELYGLSAIASPSPSERDQNFLLLTEAGERFVLKIANATEAGDLLEAQNAAMAHLGRSLQFCPRVVPTSAGNEIGSVQSPDGRTHFVRLVSYLPGVPLGSTRYHSPALRRDLGRNVGLLDAALASFDHPAVHRDFHWDLANGLRIVRQYEGLITDAELREAVGKLAAELRAHRRARAAVAAPERHPQRRQRLQRPGRRRQRPLHAQSERRRPDRLRRHGPQLLRWATWRWPSRMPSSTRPTRSRPRRRSSPAITQPIPWKKRNSRRCSVW